MPTHPPPDNVRCQPRSASTSFANDVAGIDLGTWSRNHALSSLRNASSAGVNDRSTLRTCPPNAGAVNSYRDVALGRSPPVSDHADDDAGVRRGLLRPRDWFVVETVQKTVDRAAGGQRSSRAHSPRRRAMKGYTRCALMRWRGWGHPPTTQPVRLFRLFELRPGSPGVEPSPTGVRRRRPADLVQRPGGAQFAPLDFSG